MLYWVSPIFHSALQLKTWVFLGECHWLMLTLGKEPQIHDLETTWLAAIVSGLPGTLGISASRWQRFWFNSYHPEPCTKRKTRETRGKSCVLEVKWPNKKWRRKGNLDPKTKPLICNLPNRLWSEKHSESLKADEMLCSFQWSVVIAMGLDCRSVNFFMERAARMC